MDYQALFYALVIFVIWSYLTFHSFSYIRYLLFGCIECKACIQTPSPDATLITATSSGNTGNTVPENIGNNIGNTFTENSPNFAENVGNIGNNFAENTATTFSENTGNVGNIGNTFPENTMNTSIEVSRGT